MNAIALTLLTAIVGVDVGWQPLDDGGFEYIIQIEPQLLDTLKSGNDLVSDLPPQLWGVRTYRITVGNGRLPRTGEQPLSAANPPAAVPPTKVPPAASGTDTEPPAAVPPATVSNEASATSDPELNPPAAFSPPEATRELGVAQTANEAPATAPPDESEAEVQYRLSVVTAELPPVADVAPDVGPVSDAADALTADSAADPAPEGAAVKPWGLLTLAMLGLFLSLGFNAFLGWVTWGFRQRYAALVDDLDAPHPQTA